MQTDILQKQLQTSLQDLKAAIDKFEKHSSPSTQYAEQLHTAIHQANKLVSAYLVLKEQKDVSPDLNLHIKLMSVPTPEEKQVIVEAVKEEVVAEPLSVPVKEEPKIIEVAKPVEIIKEIHVEPPVIPTEPIKPVTKEFPKIAISINDKFRFINELFASNSTEYNIAVEQINAVTSLHDLNSYLTGLKSIYDWKDDNEVVKNLFALSQKRFS